MWSTIGLIRDKYDIITDKVGFSTYALLFIFNILYFGTLIGIVYLNTEYINTFNLIVHTLLCLFLMYRFNPLRKNIEIKHYDQIIIFSTAVFLLLNLGIVKIIKTKIVDGQKLFLNTNTKSSS